MKIYDTITADQIEERDLILIDGTEQVEVTEIIDEDSVIMVKGVSFDTGDSETYLLNASAYVDLWTADDDD